MNVTHKKESVSIERPSHLATPRHSLHGVSLILFPRLSIAITKGAREGERRGPTRVPCAVCGRLAVGNESDVQSFVVIRVGVLVTHFLFVICECRIQRVVED
jgi:hypothetical protein